MRPANHAPVAAEVPGKLKIPNKTLPNRKARGGHSLLQKRHRVDGSSDDLAVDLMKDVFSLSVIVFRKDKVPVKKSRGGHWLYKFKKGFQQWCATKSDPKHKLAHNTKECVSGFNVKGKESLRQIDAHSEDYAFAFKPFFAEDHKEDVEKGVATPEEKQNTHSRKKSLTCLTVSTGEFPHTVQALGEENLRVWESGTFYQMFPLAVVSTTDPANCARSAPGGVDTAPASASSASKTRLSSSPKGAADDKSASKRSLLSWALSDAWLLCVSVGAVFAVGMVCGCWCCVLFGGRSGSSPDPVETQEDEPLEETGGPGRGEAGPQGATGGAEGKVHVAAAGAPSSLAAAAATTPEHNPEAVAAGTAPRPLDSEFWAPETQGRIPNTPTIRYSLDSEMRDTLQPDSGTSFIAAAPAVSKTKRKIKSTRKGRGAVEKQNTAGL
eukprot:g11642.t1